VNTVALEVAASSSERVWHESFSLVVALLQSVKTQRTKHEPLVIHLLLYQAQISAIDLHTH